MTNEKIHYYNDFCRCVECVKAREITKVQRALLSISEKLNKLK